MRQKRVLLGVCGGIAAYKSAQLARDLGRKGFEVRVILTQAALAFIQPLTFQALTGHSVHTDLLDPEAEAGMGHIELAKWADLLLIAPATANSIAQMAAGLAPDLLSNVYLATKAPVVIAPAMNQAMWQHAATQANIALLTQRGLSILGPAAGEQACGDVGAGRMMEPENLADAVASLLEQQQGQALPGKLLKGKRLLINAGPTREALDPVRYISNHSSGKMGFALARAAVAMGAEVSLVHGPVNLSPPQGVTAIAVQSAEQMLEACLDQAGRSDLFIAAAAVADFRAQTIAEQKLKKGDEDKILIEFIKNPDILQTVAALKKGPLCVGFAAETENVEIYARKKLETKKLDAIIANDVSDKSIGFNSEDNAVVIITAEDKVSFAKAPKTQLAEQILHWLAKELLACKVPASN